jgi:hypothetical protein
MKAGAGLGKAVEVDALSDELDMNEFLRVRVEIPYNKRIQPQLAVGVKGKPGQVKTYKLKYERIPYYCEHCGFMGHKKDTCEKRRRGVPSLDYEAYELRCSPFKKFESRAHFVPAGQTRRGLSYGSFGSAESRKSARPSRSHEYSYNKNQVPTSHRQEEPELEDMPPLENIVPERGMVVVGAYDGFDEHEMPANEEVEQNLLGKVDAMQMESTPQILNPAGNCEQRTTPFVQFSDEDVPDADPSQASKKYVVEQNFFWHMQQSSGASPELGGRMGPRSSDMIPAMRGISNLYVSFGSATDISMANADSVLGKRTARE